MATLAYKMFIGSFKFIFGRFFFFKSTFTKTIATLLQEGDEEVEVEDEDHEGEEDDDEEDDEDNVDGGEDEDDRGEIRMHMGSDGECDELDDLPNSRGNQWKGPISRKASQTSVYLQEWDIPFEQLDLGELIGKVRNLPNEFLVCCILEKNKKSDSLCFVYPGPLGKSAQGPVARRGGHPAS